MSENPPFPGVSFHKVGEGNLGPLVREYDWSKTPLGAMEDWPCSLTSYVSMMLALPTPAVIFWGEEQVQIYNDTYSTIMGPRHPEHLGSTFKQCWPETYPIINPWMKKVIGNGEVVIVERSLIPLTRHGSSEEAHFTFTLSPLRDDEGKIAGVMQLVTEVTDIVLSERRLEMLRQLASTGIFEDEGLDQMVQVLSTNTADIPFSSIYLPGPVSQLQLVNAVGDLKEVYIKPELLEEVFRDGTQKEFRLDGATRKFLALPIRNNESAQSRGVVVFGLSPLLRFNKSYKAFLIATAREIALSMEMAEQRRTARLLKENEQRLQAIVHNMGEGLVLADSSGNILLQNPASLKMHGFNSAEEMLKKLSSYPNFFRLSTVEGEELSLEDWPLSRVLRGEKFIEYEVQVERVDTGKKFFASYSGTSIMDESKKTSIALMTLRDVTYRIHSEQELKKAVSARDEFLSIASHELKTPVTSLKMQLQMTTRAVKPETNEVPPAPMLAKVLEVSHRQVDRLTHLIDDLLDVSRIEAGKLSFKFEDVELVSLIKEIEERFSHTLSSSHTQLSFKAQKEVYLKADKFRIEQVITNLISNAIKYGGGKPIGVSLQATPEKAVIMVKDDGIGISSEYKEKIFGRFERATSHRNISGLGLGLYISKQIIDAHNGSIEVESAEGQGSTFIVELPR